MKWWISKTVFSIIILNTALLMLTVIFWKITFFATFFLRSVNFQGISLSTVCILGTVTNTLSGIVLLKYQVELRALVDCHAHYIALKLFSMLLSCAMRCTWLASLVCLLKKSPNTRFFVLPAVCFDILEAFVRLVPDWQPVAVDPPGRQRGARPAQTTRASLVRTLRPHHPPCKGLIWRFLFSRCFGIFIFIFGMFKIFVYALVYRLFQAVNLCHISMCL